MSNGSNSPPSSPTRTRRPSVPSTPRLSNLLGRSPPSSDSTQPTVGPIATAAAQASAQQRRRTSLAGLAGSPTTSLFSNGSRNRNSSMGSSSSPNGNIEECAVDESDGPPNQAPHSPFARRMSFGTKALHDSRTGGGSSATESYNWSEQIRSRAERSASLSQRQHPRASMHTAIGSAVQKPASIAIPEQPARELPQQQKKPDHFQERILKGDFYMD